MARLASISPAQATGKVKEILDTQLKGLDKNIFRGMSNSPGALGAYTALSGALKQGTLSQAEIEAIQLAVGQANGCEYCVSAHTVIGKGAGLSEQQTIEARRGKMADPKLAALTRFALTLQEKRGNVSDEDLKAVRAAGYNDGNIADAVAAFALATYTNYFNHVNQTEVDFPAAPKI